MKPWAILVALLGVGADQPFIKINSECFITYKTLYACSDIHKIIDYDPDKTLDINYICNRTSINQFDNQQFADRINYRFQHEGFTDCNVSVINSLNNIQFENQCPKIVNEYCLNY